jgi:hypothetical protein
MTTALADGSLVTVDGRAYTVRLDPVGCAGPQHSHPQPHADGRPGSDSHHHHAARCGELPRQVTLIPAWEPAPRHTHHYERGRDGLNRCTCRAQRRLVSVNLSDGRALVAYDMPPDADHPSGWSYERREAADR